MANTSKKSSAEAYRERRKKQITRASKSSAKKTAASEKIVKIVVTTICIVLAVALVGYSTWSLSVNLLGIPQRLITVVTINGYDISAAEFNYYYSGMMTQMANYSDQIESQYASTYGEGVGASYTGYDSSKAPDAQSYTGSSDDEDDGLPDDATWSDYFELNAPRRAYVYHKLYEEAVDKGYELTDDEQETIDEKIDTMRDDAYDNNYSLKRYLTLSIGEGVSESLYRELLERDSIVVRYMTDINDDFDAKITDKEIKAYYEDNTEDYDSVNFRMFTFTYTTTDDDDDTTYTKAQAKKLAYEMLDDITTNKTFNDVAYDYALDDDKEDYEEDSATLAQNITYTTISQTDEDLAKWLFKDGRKVNDKTVILNEDATAYYVVCLSKTSSLLQTIPPTVRHILVQFDTTDDSGNTVEVTDAIKKAAKESAEEIYTEWKNGDKTEDSFAALAEEKSEDTGSASDGGLIEQVVIGQTVPSFEKWSYASGRKAGDTGIIESSYGYHIMYYVGKSKEAYWKTSVRDTLGTEDYNDYMDNLNSEAKENTDTHDRLFNYFSGRLIEQIDRNVENSSSSSTTTS